MLLAVLVAAPVPYAGGDESGAVARITGVLYLGDLPTLVADRRGLFAAGGVEADVRYGFSGKRNLEKLRAGETDFALMALTPLVIDLLQDPDPGEADDPVILASLVHSTRLNQVLALTGSGLERPADLVGRRVGIMRGTNAEFVWSLFAAYHGLDPGAVEVVDRPVPDLLTAILDQRIDAAVLWEPWTTRLHQGTGGAVRVFPGSNVYTAKWVLVARRASVARDAGQARAVLDAYREAIEYIEQHTGEALEIYARQAAVSPDLLAGVHRDLSFELSLDWSVIATLQQQLQWAGHAGYERAGPPPRVLSLIEPGPLRSLAPHAVGIPAVKPEGGGSDQ